jgi:predicted membrane metal-binding protein
VHRPIFTTAYIHLVPEKQLARNQNQRDPAARRGELELTLLSQSPLLLAYPTDIIILIALYPLYYSILSVTLPCAYFLNCCQIRLEYCILCHDYFIYDISFRFTAPISVRANFDPIVLHIQSLLLEGL